MLKSPIFIIGTERSGSNLLRLLLNSHSRIAIPHPPHLMRDMAALEGRYGDLKRNENFAALTKDCARIVNMHFAPWPFQVDGATLFAHAETRSLYAIYAALYDLYMDHEGKTRWGCKSTFMHQCIGKILKNHRFPKFIHLVRDPRDVAASAEHSIFSNYHPYNQAALWSKQQAIIEGWRPKLGRQLLRVRYEDLTAEPVEELRRIMQFLEEDFEDGQMEFYRSKEAKTLAELSQSWENCQQPVKRSSVGRFRQELKPVEIDWVEYHAADLMREYGYELCGSAKTKPTLFTRAQIQAAERMRMLKVEGASLLKDDNFSLRWKKRIYLKYLSQWRTPAHG